jgi:hypothetical protein
VANWIPDHGSRRVNKFGYNLSVPNGSYAGVLSQGGAFPFLTAASTLQIKAGGDAADDGGSSPLGTGAHSVTIEGLDGTGLEVSATLATAGTSASSATTQTFLRPYRAYVTTAGAYGGVNADDITIQNTSGSPLLDLLEIPAGYSQTQHCQYTVPLGYSAYLKAVVLTADGQKPADFQLWSRSDILTVTPPYAPARCREYWDGVLGVRPINPDTYILRADELTDLWIDARGGGAGTEVSASMEIILVAQ